jgi:hypothetical protein
VFHRDINTGNIMSDGLELSDSRIDHIEVADGVATIHFSHAYIHKSKGTKSKGTPGRDPGTGWSQEARLIFWDATALAPIPPSLPANIEEGFIEVGGRKQELLPLPFRHKVPTRLWLRLADGAEVNIIGEQSSIELQGRPIFLEDFI